MFLTKKILHPVELFVSILSYIQMVKHPAYLCYVDQILF